jgi:hypothetical protein
MIGFCRDYVWVFTSISTTINDRFIHNSYHQPDFELKRGKANSTNRFAMYSCRKGLLGFSCAVCSSYAAWYFGVQSFVGCSSDLSTVSYSHWPFSLALSCAQIIQCLQYFFSCINSAKNERILNRRCIKQQGKK